LVQKTARSNLEDTAPDLLYRAFADEVTLHSRSLLLPVQRRFQVSRTPSNLGLEKGCCALSARTLLRAAKHRTPVIDNDPSSDANRTVP
jgi:hypothetical protein